MFSSVMKGVERIFTKVQHVILVQTVGYCNTCLADSAMVTTIPV
jgi:hypothetical protein